MDRASSRGASNRCYICYCRWTIYDHMDKNRFTNRNSIYKIFGNSIRRKNESINTKINRKVIGSTIISIKEFRDDSIGKDG